MSAKLDKKLDNVRLIQGGQVVCAGSLDSVIGVLVSRGRGVYEVVYEDKSFSIDRGHEFFHADGGYRISLFCEGKYRDWSEDDARSALLEFFSLVFFGEFDFEDVKRMGYCDIEVALSYCIIDWDSSEDDEWIEFLCDTVDVPLENTYDVWVGDREPEWCLETFTDISEAFDFAKGLDREEAGGNRHSFVIHEMHFRGEPISTHIIKRFHTHVDKEAIAEKVRELCLMFGLRNGYGVFTVGDRKICIRIKDHPASPMNFEAYNKYCSEKYSIVIGEYAPDPCDLYNETVFEPEVEVEEVVDYVKELLNV